MTFTAKNGGVILTIILVSYTMIILDASIVFTGLPLIQADLQFSPAQLSWVQSIYNLTFGGFMLLGARAGDIVGRRRMFQIGLGLFTAASVLIGLADSAMMMIAARGLQGAGAAILGPSSLALLSATFPEGRERTHATALYGSTAGISASVGLVIGGVLAQMLSWRVGFFINLPVGILMAVLGHRYIEETERHRGRFDSPGAVLSTLGVGAMIWGILHVAENGGLHPQALLIVLAGAAIIAVFFWHEARAAQPIMPLSLFDSPARVGAYLARFLYLGAMVGFFFFSSQFMQIVLGFSPLQAGLGFLPMTAVNFAVAMQVPKLTARLGTARLLQLGVLVTAVGMVWLSRAGLGDSYALAVALPMVLVGAGQGLCFAPLTTAGMAGTDRRNAGAASGMVNVAHQFGMSCGLALLVAVAALSTGGITDDPAIMAAGVRAALTTGSLLLVLALLVARALIPHRAAETPPRAA